MNWLHDLIGNGSNSIVWWQMTIRAAIIFIYLLVLLRVGRRRAFGRWTPFDTVLAILLGSTLSRGLTGNAPFVPTLAAGALLVLLHGVLTQLSFQWASFAALVKGRPVKLMEHGRLLHRNLRSSGVSEGDLKEQLRSEMKTDDLKKVEDAYLERGGTISFIAR